MTFFQTKDLSKKELLSLFEMYEISYKAIGKDRWFYKPDDLLKYPYVIIYKKYAIFIQYLNNINKMSLLIHDGTNEGKQDLFNKVARKLVTVGWALEASGAVAYILQTRYQILPIRNLSLIELALDIKHKYETIELNKEYDPLNPTDYTYTRKTKDGYEMNKVLFGILCPPLKSFATCAFKSFSSGERHVVYVEEKF